MCGDFVGAIYVRCLSVSMVLKNVISGSIGCCIGVKKVLMHVKSKFDECFLDIFVVDFREIGFFRVFHCCFKGILRGIKSVSRLFQG